MLSLVDRVANRLRNRVRTRRWHHDLASGRRGEDLTHRYLWRHGFTHRRAHYRPQTSAGEIDLIAWESERLVFIEVKSRATAEFGTPDRAVDPEKQIFLERAAREYARRAGVEWSRTRFDIVSVLLTFSAQIELLRDAFGANRRL